MRLRSIFCAALVVAVCATPALAQEGYTRTEDVIYGRKFGTALTMDVFRPKEKPNGAAIVMAVSGGWFSSHEAIPKQFGGGGFTMFAVVHGSQPRFTIEDAVQDLNRAVRFIRYHAKDYGIDPDRIGITGGSAGGHLSLMQGVKPAPPNEKSADPVDRVSSRVQAVACLMPPTDFLNYGEPGKIAWTTTLNWLPAPFEFEKLEPAVKGNAFSMHFLKVSADEQKKIACEMSPIYWVTKESPPTLIIHGDADNLVPIEQSRRIVEKFEAAKVPVKLEVRKGKGHGWADVKPDVEFIMKWFGEHLKKSETSEKK